MSSVASASSAASLAGVTFLAGQRVKGTGPGFKGHDPVQEAELEPAFMESSLTQVDEACRTAANCFDEFRHRSREQRALLLDTIGSQILALGESLLTRAAEETGLPLARLQGERARTIAQLQLFATVVREGSFVGNLNDSALPDRQPLPRPELMLRRVAVGPVAVFGASNFPLAFSVAGGDSASALAAGCPLIVKAHPSHPGTSELVASAIQTAVEKTGMPAGIFSMLQGVSHEVGSALVTHPDVTAVAFTGSRKGGLALMQLAASREVPIPVFAEMSSVNPVFLFSGALRTRGAEIAAGYVDSLTLGTGQFCTQPGLVFAQRGPELDAFLTAAAQALRSKSATPMLNAGIYKAYRRSLGDLKHADHLTLVEEGANVGSKGLCGAPALFRTSFASFQQHLDLQDEVFGPSSIVVVCDNKEQMLAAAESLEGQLTATLHVNSSDYAQAEPFVPVLERKAGRLLVNGFPTGVEVAQAMVHGGPFPATSDSRFTSVGAQAIYRFLRPVCYQNFPQELQPAD